VNIDKTARKPMQDSKSEIWFKDKKIERFCQKPGDFSGF
jgi:hypothetical protein